MEKFQELEDEVQAVRDQLQVGYACRQQWAGGGRGAGCERPLLTSAKGSEPLRHFLTPSCCCSHRQWGTTGIGFCASPLLLLLQADKEDLADWEERNAAERNQGLFFQRLHKASPREKSKAGDTPGGPLDLDQEVRACRLNLCLPQSSSCTVQSWAAVTYGLLPIHMPSIIGRSS